MSTLVILLNYLEFACCSYSSYLRHSIKCGLDPGLDSGLWTLDSGLCLKKKKKKKKTDVTLVMIQCKDFGGRL